MTRSQLIKEVEQLEKRRQILQRMNDEGREKIEQWENLKTPPKYYYGILNSLDEVEMAIDHIERAEGYIEKAIDAFDRA